MERKAPRESTDALVDVNTRRIAKKGRTNWIDAVLLRALNHKLNKNENPFFPLRTIFIWLLNSICDGLDAYALRLYVYILHAIDIKL